jgi:hypothetical protein
MAYLLGTYFNDSRFVNTVVLQHGVVIANEEEKGTVK